MAQGKIFLPHEISTFDPSYLRTDSSYRADLHLHKSSQLQYARLDPRAFRKHANVVSLPGLFPQSH